MNLISKDKAMSGKKDNVNPIVHFTETNPKKIQKIAAAHKRIEKLIDSIETLYELDCEYIKQQEAKITDIALIDENPSDAISKKTSKINREINSNLNKAIKELEKFKKYGPKLLPANNEIIRLENVHKFYSTKRFNSKVLSDINLVINEGDFVVILGTSGSGKTSLMNVMAGIDQPTYGSVNVAKHDVHLLNNRDLTKFRKNNIGYVFQAYGLLPNLTVYENVCMGAFLGETLSKQKKGSISNSKVSKEDQDRILDILDKMEMKEHMNKYPYELSGGQKQRTSIARILAKNPKIIFGDEPTAAVDEEMSDSIIELFSKINKEYKKTIVIITHDEKIAKKASKVIIVKDGCINEVIDNTIIEAPKVQPKKSIRK